MASIQRIALFVFFDSVESDLVTAIRAIPFDSDEILLTDDEREKARIRLERNSLLLQTSDDGALLHGLDIGDKYSVLMRHLGKLPKSAKDYYKSVKKNFDRAIPVRNAVMHGRPLTVTQHTQAFAFASDLVKAAGYWPILAKSFSDYNRDPEGIVKSAQISFIDGEVSGVFHNLPSPDYDDTGFIPRDTLQADLRKKILGRHPVITVLGDGGDGKTSITLQCLHEFAASNDHPFEGIVWVSAKSNKLGINEIERIEGAILDSMDIFRSISNIFGDEGSAPMERVKQLLESNKILLVIDNLETILDQSIKKFAESIPGESKIVFTSRVPLGSDLTVKVGPFSSAESLKMLRALAASYNIPVLKSLSSEKLAAYANRLFNKPLLLKWFALGVASGASPDKIVANPDKALSFCLENVISALSPDTRRLAGILAVVPGAISVSIITHVVKISAVETESCIAELLRFGLLEQTDDRFDQTYRLRNFARSYISRQTKLKPIDVSAIISSLRTIENTFNSEKLSGNHDRYNIKTYVVASKSDAVAVQKLRSAALACIRGDFDVAETALEHLKITNPNYFEVFRVEAFIAARQLDYPRAIDCYEVAVEIGGDQPQLRYFYSSFLSRDVRDHEGAYDQISIALEMEPEDPKLSMEAARMAMNCLKFENAKQHLDDVKPVSISSQKNAALFIDVRVNFYSRAISYHLDKATADDAAIWITDLGDFLSNINIVDVDIRGLESFSRLKSTLNRLAERGPTVAVSDLEAAIKILENFTPKAIHTSTSGAGVSIGKMKLVGRQTSFAFLESEGEDDTFIHRSDVEPFTWDELITGRFVRFDRIETTEGKSRAGNIFLL
jgi:cold shock CspA family protein/tetratricopeptide (TPR) repeat protein